MRILHRLLIAFACVVAIGIAQNVATVTNMRSLSRDVEHATTNPLSQVEAARNAWETFGEANSDLHEFLQGIRYASSVDALKNFKAHVTKIDNELSVLRTTNPSPDIVEGTETANALLQQWQSSALKLLGSKAETSIPAPHVMERLENGIDLGLKKIVTLARSEAEMSKAEIIDQLYWAEKTILAGAALALLIGIGVAVAASVSLTRPLVAIKARMRALMDGDTENPVQHQDRQDEIGAIAQAVEFMREKLIERQGLEADRERIAADREETAAERARNADEQEQSAKVVGAALERIASGDLTVRITDEVSPSYQ